MQQATGLMARWQGSPGQGKSVNHFGMLVTRIAKALRHLGFDHEATQLAHEREAQQGLVLTVLPHSST